MIEFVRVEEIRPGDEVVLPRGGARRVVRVERYDDGTRVVVYETFSEDAYGKNPGRPNGLVREPRRVERGLRPLGPGDRWPARRTSDPEPEL